MQARKQVLMTAFIILIAGFTLILSLGLTESAYAYSSPWGKGTHYNENTKTLTIVSGKHVIDNRGKSVGYRLMFFDNLVVKGGNIKLSEKVTYLTSLNMKKGRLIIGDKLSVGKNLKISGGSIVASTNDLSTLPLWVGDSLFVNGGSITVKSNRSKALSVVGDFIMKRGTVNVSTRENICTGIRVGGNVTIAGGALKAVTKGKYSGALQVSGDITLKGGSINAISERDTPIHCGDILRVTGGKINARTDTGEKAIEVYEKPSIKVSCLGAIKGVLSTGMRFVKNKVVYEVTRDWISDNRVRVVKGKARNYSVSYGGISYKID